MNAIIPEAWFAKVGDLREKHGAAISQNLMLARSYPVKFSMAAIEKAPSFVEGQPFYFNNNWDVVVMLLRHLYVSVDAISRGMLIDGGDEEDEAHALANRATMKAQENKHPLLRFIWADFDDPSPENREAQTVIRYEMQKADDPRGIMTVEQILERESMWKTLWSREAFRLYQPWMAVAPAGAVSPARPEDQVDPNWKMEMFQDVGEHSLVKWDGTVPIEDRIVAGTGLFQYRLGDKKAFFWGCPRVIRVMYKPAKSVELPTHARLRRINLAPPKTISHGRTDDGRCILSQSAPDGQPHPYTLIAVVRISGDFNKNDMIRKYGVYANATSFPMRLKDMTGTQWDLSDPLDAPNAADGYILFYGVGTSRQLTMSHEGPIARKPPMAARLIDIMRGAIRPPPAPADQEPRTRHAEEEGEGPATQRRRR